MQLCCLVVLECQCIIDDLVKIEVEIVDLEDILVKFEWQCGIVCDEFVEIVDRYGDDWCIWIIVVDGDVSDEDLIVCEDVVVIIIEMGYVKCIKIDLYCSQKCGGKGVQGVGLKQDDIVVYFFVCFIYDLILFFIIQGWVYWVKVYDLFEVFWMVCGQYVVNLLVFQFEECIVQVIQICGYIDVLYLVLVICNGLVKKFKLIDFDFNCLGGIVVVNLCDNDELVGVVLCLVDDDLLLVLVNGQFIRFLVIDEVLWLMGCVILGVQGMWFNIDDWLLLLNVVCEGIYLLVVMLGGYVKCIVIEEYLVQGCGGKGVLMVMYDCWCGRLVGVLIVDDDSELYVVIFGGGVICIVVCQVCKVGWQIKGVWLMNLGEGDILLVIVCNVEESGDDNVVDVNGVDQMGN